MTLHAQAEALSTEHTGRAILLLPYEPCGGLGGPRASLRCQAPAELRGSHRGKVTQMARRTEPGCLSSSTARTTPGASSPPHPFTLNTILLILKIKKCLLFQLVFIQSSPGEALGVGCAQHMEQSRRQALQMGQLPPEPVL